MASGPSRVTEVHLDAVATLKILDHARKNPLDNVSGPLLGLEVDGKLQITNCFPYPEKLGGDDDDDALEETQYQKEMLRCLREVNMDHMEVGWYQSTYLGSALTEHLIGISFDYQKLHEESVVLIYDPVKTAQGSLSFAAYRLTAKFLAMYERVDFTHEMIKAHGLGFSEIFEEVPVFVQTSPLAQALLAQHVETAAGTLDHLDLSTHAYLEKNVRLLMTCVDDLTIETHKYSAYQRKRAQAEQKRKADNAHRQANDLPLLTEADAHRASGLTPPSRLDSLLIAGQISHYCSQISQFASQSFGKLFLAQGLQEATS